MFPQFDEEEVHVAITECDYDGVKLNAWLAAKLENPSENNWNTVAPRKLKKQEKTSEKHRSHETTSGTSHSDDWGTLESSGSAGRSRGRGGPARGRGRGRGGIVSGDTQRPRPYVSRQDRPEQEGSEQSSDTPSAPPTTAQAQPLVGPAPITTNTPQHSVVTTPGPKSWVAAAKGGLMKTTPPPSQQTSTAPPASTASTPAAASSQPQAGSAWGEGKGSWSAAAIQNTTRPTTATTTTTAASWGNLGGSPAARPAENVDWDTPLAASQPVSTSWGKPPLEKTPAAAWGSASSTGASWGTAAEQPAPAVTSKAPTSAWESPLPLSSSTEESHNPPSSPSRKTQSSEFQAVAKPVSGVIGKPLHSAGNSPVSSASPITSSPSPAAQVSPQGVNFFSQIRGQGFSGHDSWKQAESKVDDSARGPVTLPSHFESLSLEPQGSVSFGSFHPQEQSSQTQQTQQQSPKNTTLSNSTQTQQSPKQQPHQTQTTQSQKNVSSQGVQADGTQSSAPAFQPDVNAGARGYSAAPGWDSQSFMMQMPWQHMPFQGFSATVPQPGYPPKASEGNGNGTTSPTPGVSQSSGSVHSVPQPYMQPMLGHYGTYMPPPGAGSQYTSPNMFMHMQYMGYSYPTMGPTLAPTNPYGYSGMKSYSQYQGGKGPAQPGRYQGPHTAAGAQYSGQPIPPSTYPYDPQGGMRLGEDYGMYSGYSQGSGSPNVSTGM